MTTMCIHSTMLGDICAGIEPANRTGDFTDVVMTDADGRRTLWPEGTHLPSEEMDARYARWSIVSTGFRPKRTICTS